MSDTNENTAVPSSAIADRIFAIMDELTALRTKMERLEIERSVLENLAVKAVVIPGSSARGETPIGRLGATAAVLKLVSENPGITKKQLLDRLQHTVETTARNKRSALSATVFNLRSRKAIHQDGHGRLRLVDKEVASEGDSLL